MSNSLHPDQARQFVGPDLDPNCLQKCYHQMTKVVNDPGKSSLALAGQILKASAHKIRTSVKSAFINIKNYFLISQPKHMLRVLKRTV